jgi:two-component system, CAI-1 autoinducer sensor kinase/phosphatase CqsS
MYSLLPALVSGLFIAYGCYVLAAKGLNRTTGSFFLLCMTTFFWQGTWAILFTAESAQTADALIRFGYVLIAFLPTTLYHFLTEISARRQDLRWVAVSYGISGVFAILSLSSNFFISGHYHYDWGYYPKAGPLHLLHVLQTSLVVSRGLMITWQQERVATGSQKSRLQLCVYSNLIYFFAAIDYLCNYGFDFYPPGVIFIAISLGMMGYAASKYELMSSYAAAATIAHELRTPLATIRMQAGHAAQQLPEILRELQEARASSGFGGISSADATKDLDAHRQLELMCQKIIQQVDRTNQMIDLILASARMEHIDTSNFSWHSMQACAVEMLDSYPFSTGQQRKVHLSSEGDFEFYGSQPLLVFAISNLIKNSLYAMKAADKGEIFITIRPAEAGSSYNTITVTDTASGIPKDVLPHIFDTYYSTKDSAGAGVGLAFCLRVAKAFGGQIRCESVEGEFTTFTLSLPARKKSPDKLPVGHSQAAFLSAT